MTASTAACGLPPAAMMRLLVKALSRTRTVPVGESIPVGSGGSDVVSAIHMPPTQLPISIAQIATGMPLLSSPGNIRAPNETMLAIRIIEVMTPATVSENTRWERVPKREAVGTAGAAVFATAAMDCGVPTGFSMEKSALIPSDFGLAQLNLR